MKVYRRDLVYLRSENGSGWHGFCGANGRAVRERDGKNNKTIVFKSARDFPCRCSCACNLQYLKPITYSKSKMHLTYWMFCHCISDTVHCRILYQLFTMTVWLPGSHSLMLLPSITRECHTANCRFLGIVHHLLSLYNTVFS